MPTILSGRARSTAERICAHDMKPPMENLTKMAHILIARARPTIIVDEDIFDDKKF
jgi:hypothetical protein